MMKGKKKSCESARITGLVVLFFVFFWMVLIYHVRFSSDLYVGLR